MTERIGILVDVTDSASSVLKGIGSAGKSSLDTIRGAGEKAGDALRGVVMAATFLNQGLELAKKGFEIFRMLILDNITAMVEYRGEADAIAKRFRKMGDDAKYTKAVIADLLTPAILGMSDAFNEAGASVVDYVNINRKLMAENIITFLADTGRVLISVVAKSLTVVSLIVSGLIETWHLLSAAVNDGISGILRGVEGLLRGFADLAEWTGKGELAQSMRDAADTSKLMSDTFADGAWESIEAMKEQVAAQEGFEQSIKDTEKAALEFTDNAEKGALEYASTWKGVKRHVDEATSAIRNQRDAWASLEVSAATYYERVASFGEKDAAFFQKQSDAKKNLEVQNANAMASAIGSIGAAWTAVALAAVNGSEQMGVAVTNAVIDSAMVAINAAAAMAAAKAFAAHQDFPIVGVALGLAAAAAAAGIAKGFLNKVPKAEKGMRIPGGNGSESILHTMRSDETVLDPASTKR